MNKDCEWCDEEDEINTTTSCESCARVSCCSKHDFCFGCKRIICFDCSEAYNHSGHSFEDGRHGVEIA